MGINENFAYWYSGISPKNIRKVNRDETICRAHTMVDIEKNYFVMKFKDSKLDEKMNDEQARSRGLIQ